MRKFLAFFLGLALAGSARAAEPPSLKLRLAGPPQTMFTPARDACDGNDVPDAPVRAFRDAAGGVVMFGLHDVNRAFRGASLDAMQLDCRVVLGSSSNADPAAYDDRSWITALWTRDGVHIEALVHHEFQANEHPGRCAFKDYMQCWYNSILAVHSSDGGATFARPQNPVVAAVPFRSDFDQGRHRGFFNPSNIFSYQGQAYFFASTTGWAGQDGGVCLFRNADPARRESWRAWDGKGFASAFPDPYAVKTTLASHCTVIAPFPAPVGAVVNYGGTFVAVFQARRDANLFPVSGFYYATSSNLLVWSAPRLLVPGATLYDDPCGAGERLIAYPSLLDDAAKSRIFADVGGHPWLYFASLALDGCAITGQRELLRVKVDIGNAK